MKSKIRLLLISENPGHVQAIVNADTVCEDTITLYTAESLSEGLSRFMHDGVESILLHLPQQALFKSLETLCELRIGLPVIALIRSGEEYSWVRAIKEGAHHYLFENTVDMASLVRSVRFAEESCRITEDLKKANLKIGEHEKLVFEIESLKETIDKYGSSAHELNQPLTALLGSIYLMKLDRNDPEKFSRHMERIDDSGRRISAIVKKIQAMRHEKNRYYLGNASFKNPDQMPTPGVEVPDNNFEDLNNLFRTVQARCNGAAI